MVTSSGGGGSGSSSGNLRCHQIASQTFSIITQYGDMQVVKRGVHVGANDQQAHHHHHHHHQQQHQQQPQGQTRPVIMTFHDLGLNSELQFASFCEYEEVKLMLQTFNMVHVNFIGQEFVPAGEPPNRKQVACDDLADDFRYPSVEQLAECIVDVCAQLRVRSFIGLAVGAGAHVVSLLALRRPDLVDGLFLINPVITNCTITEWLYFKMSAIANQHGPQQSPKRQSSGHEPEESAPAEAPAPHPVQQHQTLRRLLSAVHLNSSHSREPAEPATPVAGSHSGGSGEPVSGSKLRRMILSRNFRLGQRQHHLQRERSLDTGSARHQHSGQQQQQQPMQRRPPIEYLMYHHFGPSSIQRYRRSSDTPASETPGESPRHGGVPEGAELDSNSLGQKGQSRSHESIAACTRDPPSPSLAARELGPLSADQLAGLGGERQRHAHMQAVYRHYFGQLNSHNLWLFAQSFAKRKTLSLRKDCGAAAHAAAAAAALGTSICTAFVGPGQPAGGSGAECAALDGPPLTPVAAPPEVERAQVAGTKVKRTFTCQTLIMCSSVRMHCDRSFKLMSLLNPLQATWIKTDHLLVLEERPDKVCQALRLFLQGIGYSMSTYERRLRLSSNHDSISSADSLGSAKSANSADGQT